MENNKQFQLVRRSEYLNLQSIGKRFRVNDWLMLNYTPNQIKRVRMGWTVQKKLGNAVFRNRIKRLCREYLFVTKKEETPIGLDLNFVFKPSTRGREVFKRIQFNEFKEIVDRALVSLHKNY